MHENVRGVELVDRAVQRQLADVGVGQHPVLGGRVVQQGLHRVTVRPPGRYRVLVHRRPAGQLDARAGGEERGEPLGQVPHHVARGPAGDRGRGVPVAGREDPFGEQPADLPVPLCGVLR